MKLETRSRDDRLGRSLDLDARDNYKLTLRVGGAVLVGKKCARREPRNLHHDQPPLGNYASLNTRLKDGRIAQDLFSSRLREVQANLEMAPKREARLSAIERD